ncbi:hypothetical protein MKX01_018183 [Papaver californicum]|nr:hypothetical protein MKX01_018183 [Papaver californicum]
MKIACSSSSSSMKIVMAMALCLLLLGGFSVEATGRINDGAAATTTAITTDINQPATTTAITTDINQPIVCFLPQERCQSGQDCVTCCKSLGYSRGAVLLEFCCCSKDAMKVTASLPN